MGLSLKNFHKPTPLKMKAIGYSLLSFSTAVAGYINLFEEFEWKKYVVGAIMVSGVLGKWITDLTKEETPDEKP